MALFVDVANALAALVAVGVIARAATRLLENPEEDHEDLVPARERHATTLAGVPVLLVAASTLTDGPLAVPLNPIVLLVLGGVLVAYPDLSPSGI